MSLRAVTFNLTLPVVIGPWVWGWCQKVASADLEAKAVGSAAKTIELGVETCRGMEHYVTDCG